MIVYYYIILLLYIPYYYTSLALKIRGLNIFVLSYIFIIFLLLRWKARANTRNSYRAITMAHCTISRKHSRKM